MASWSQLEWIRLRCSTELRKGVLSGLMLTLDCLTLAFTRAAPAVMPAVADS